MECFRLITQSLLHSPISGIDPRGRLCVVVNVVDLPVVVRGHVPSVRQRVSIACSVIPTPIAQAGARIDAAGAAVIGTVRTARRTYLIELLWHCGYRSLRTHCSRNHLCVIPTHQNRWELKSDGKGCHEISYYPSPHCTILYVGHRAPICVHTHCTAHNYSCGRRSTALLL